MHLMIILVCWNTLISSSFKIVNALPLCANDTMMSSCTEQIKFVKSYYCTIRTFCLPTCYLKKREVTIQSHDFAFRSVCYVPLAIRREHKRKISGLKNKSKAVPLQAWSGPGGSRKLRFPDFKKTAQDGGMVVNLTHRPPLPPGNTPGTHFC